MDDARHIRLVFRVAVVIAIFAILSVMTFVTLRPVRNNTGVVRADPMTPEAETYLDGYRKWADAMLPTLNRLIGVATTEPRTCREESDPRKRGSPCGFPMN
jgi:hypothetical protein